MSRAVSQKPEFSQSRARIEPKSSQNRAEQSRNASEGACTESRDVVQAIFNALRLKTEPCDTEPYDIVQPSHAVSR